MAEWVETALGDHIKIRHGYAFKGKDITKEETNKILVTPGNFYIGGGFKPDKLKYFAGDHPEDYELEKDDLIVTMTDLSKEGDTLGYSVKVPEIPGKVFLHNQRIGLVSVCSKELDKEFLYWLMRTREYQYYIVGAASGTSIRHTSPSGIKSYSFLLPSLSEQKAIAEVLTSLDDKIDLLHRQNKTLESLAETLFRQWFIIEASADWEAQTLGDFAENLKDSIKPQNLEAGACYIGLEHIDGYNIALNRHGDSSEVTSNKYQFIENDILFGKLRPYFHKVCLAPFNGVCSTDILVIRPKKPEYLAFCLFAFFQKDVIEYATAGSGGTRMPRTNWQDLSAYPMQLPKEEVIERFNKTVVPFIERIKANIEQIRTLEQLRDTLLPKLMSGEVRVQYDTSQKTEAA